MRPVFQHTEVRMTPAPQPEAAIQALASIRPVVTQELAQAATFFGERDARMAILDQGEQRTLAFQVTGTDVLLVEVSLHGEWLGWLRGGVE